MKFSFLILFLFILNPSGYGQEDLEEDLQELESQRLERSQKIKYIEQTPNPYNVVEELNKIGYKTFKEINYLDERVILILQASMQNGPLQQMNPIDRRKLIATHVEGKPLGKVFIRFPQLLDFFNDFLGDRMAIPSLLGILHRKEDLKLYGWFSLLLFLIFFFLRRKVITKKTKFFARFVLGITFLLCYSILAFGAFYELFEKEVNPTIAVIRKSFS